MRILNHRQIQQKIKRLAIEILERNLHEEELILIGINNNGIEFAQFLLEELLQISNLSITLTRIKLNPANPIAEKILLEMPLEQLAGKAIILVDDVANTGRTLFYAFQPLMEILPKKVEVAVLVDRTHKSFPVRVDYFGLSLATTLKENIQVKIRDVAKHEVYLS